MKVFVLGTRGFPNVQGGVEKHCQELYPRLADLGCEVTVFARASYVPKDKRILEWRGVEFIHLWSSRSKSFEAIIHTFVGLLISAVKRPDILHIHAIGPSIFVPLARLFGLRVVMTHHGSDYARQKWGRFAKVVLKIGEALGVKFANKVIVVSKTARVFLRKKYQRKDMEFIPNGVKLPLNNRQSDRGGHFSGFEPGKYVFTACRFVPEKGLHDLIEAYKRLKNPEFKLVVAGDADHQTNYSRKLKKQAEEAGVILTGVISGKPLEELHSNAGLFVLPSYHEGLPIGLLEALSYGLPVLVSDIPQNKELPLPECRYFKVGDINQLSQKLKELMKAGISKKEKTQQLEFLKNDYNWDKIAQQTKKIYKTLIKPPATAAVANRPKEPASGNRGGCQCNDPL